MTEARTAAETAGARDPGLREDPYAEYARLRGEAAVQRLDEYDGRIQSWFVTRYHDVRAVLADRRLSRSPRHMNDEVRSTGIPDTSTPLKRTMFNTDPPEHTRLRRLVSRAFTPRRIQERMGPRIQQITDELLDRVASEEVADLMSALALPLPLAVISELIGVPAEDRERFRSWFSPDIAPGSTKGTWDESVAYFADLLAARRATVRADLADDEQPDLVSVLIAARDEGQALTDHEILATLTLLLLAGHETTINLIASGLLALFEHPDQLRLLRDRPELGPQAVEELLRHTNPIQRSSYLFPTTDVGVGDVTIPCGSLVTVGFASANRDPERFEDPDRVDITRADNAHLAFGHGVHYCLGAPLARLEGQIVFGTLLRRFPDLALACPLSEVRWRPRGFQRGLAALPVRLRRTAPTAATQQ
jgi:cytochrome P450